MLSTIPGGEGKEGNGWCGNEKRERKKRLIGKGGRIEERGKRKEKKKKKKAFTCSPISFSIPE